MIPVASQDASAGVPRSQPWSVGALCRAVAESLDVRFNPVFLRGELTGFSRAGSGHCYFSVKDAFGQIRCAMFRRAATLMDFTPRDGEMVDVRGRLGVYEQRGDLQLVVESMARVGAGSLFDQFLQRKARLQAEGLFEESRKRPLPATPRGIGLVTSLDAAALHDVVTTLRRRAPHIPVLLVPARVQGAEAPAELGAALENLYGLARATPATPAAPPIDVILLVRGGGSMEDLWSFNDENLVRIVSRSPVPLIAGIGHETDFTLVEFAADMRAPTPTSAAELAAPARQSRLDLLAAIESRLGDTALRLTDRREQGLDQLAQRLGRPSADLSRKRAQLDQLEQALMAALARRVARSLELQRNAEASLKAALSRGWQAGAHRLDRAAIRLEALDPRQVLLRGYAVLRDASGKVVSSPAAAPVGSHLQAMLADGELSLTVVSSQT